jgi:HAD superfamily hydrolase (TIGR01509 family)
MKPASFLVDIANWPKGFYPGAVELLAKLRQEFRVACLSNSNAVHWQRFSSLGEHFDVALSSHLLKAIKPDPLCFARPPPARATPVGGSVAFFDDSLENVVAAKEFGLQAFHVSGLAGVRGALVEAGWLR